MPRKVREVLNFLDEKRCLCFSRFSILLFPKCFLLLKMISNYVMPQQLTSNENLFRICRLKTKSFTSNCSVSEFIKKEYEPSTWGSEVKPFTYINMEYNMILVITPCRDF